MAILRELRMRQAATLLLANNLPIERVASTIGYSSRSSFCRAFVRAYKCDPSVFKNVARQEHAGRC
jgi:AraC family transcriptional activator of mtrCDE